VAKVPQLKDVVLIEDIRPCVIIGLAKSGLAIATYLSREFGEANPVPIISLWPYSEFNNRLNCTKKSCIKTVAKRGETRKVRIVDDIC
jgi:hypoxanthine phosphoribosyltransferase